LTSRLNGNLSSRAYAVNHKDLRGHLRILRLYRAESVIHTRQPSTTDERAFGVHCVVWMSGVRNGHGYPGSSHNNWRPDGPQPRY